jgi:uncharacterized RDD family membrane protein YckC
VSVAGASRGLVTPEAVLLEFETASVGSRSLALLIDLAAMFGAFIVLEIAIAAVVGVLGLPAWVLVTLITVAIFGVIFGYPIVLETVRDGRTFGKAAMGLRVVTVEGAPVRARHAAIRAAMQVVDFLLPPVGVLAILSVLLTARNQRLGDLAAGTVVLRDRNTQRPTAAFAFPPLPGYEEYVAGLDVSAITPDQYQLLRSFLTRVYTFSPGARAALARRLAAPIAQAMRHTPPPWTHDETFLASVAAAYQQRHGGTPFEVPRWDASAGRAAPATVERAPTVAPEPPPAPPAPQPPPTGGGFAPPS